MERAADLSLHAFARALRAIARGAILSAALLLIAPLALGTASARAHHHTRAHHRREHRLRHGHRRRAVRASVRVTPSTVVPCANAQTPASAANLAQMDAAVVCLINDQRIERGLPGLTVSAQLDRSAQGWTNVMVASGNFTHGPGTSFASRIGATGYDWQTAGENIATGFPTPSSVVAAWMASTGHCQNILNPSFRNVGTGMVPSVVGGWASGPSTWTQDFGLRMSQSPLSGNQGPMNGCPYG